MACRVYLADLQRTQGLYQPRDQGAVILGEGKGVAAAVEGKAMANITAVRFGSLRAARMLTRPEVSPLSWVASPPCRHRSHRWSHPRWRPCPLIPT